VPNNPSISVLLVPSQVLKAHPGSSSIPSSAPIPVAVANEIPTTQQQKQQQRQRNNVTHRQNKNVKKPSKAFKTGNLPDIYWRSVPMDHLRHHPHFEPLPLPETIEELLSLEDIRFFRQDSWQWDAVHEGRCTTSQAVAALGFLEPETGKMLGVPLSWQRGGLGAYYRLRKPALRTLAEMNQVLCNHHSRRTPTRKVDDATRNNVNTIWTIPTQGFPFPAKYMVRMGQAEIDERRRQSQRMSSTPGFDFSVRMMWGNAQEATALLTALNYFWKEDQGVKIKEVGMCGAGLLINHTTTGQRSNLLVGASPDALICYSNGTVEALEVKNHCPFFAVKSSKQKVGQGKGKRFTVRHFDIENATLPIQYIPQLMMEMLCVGEHCQSGIMVRLTATSGALILRLRRDDEWIEEMLYWLNRFQSDFVEQEEPPPSNFFLQGTSAADKERYLKFLQMTMALQKKVEVAANIPHADIQRATASRSGMANLFLDVKNIVGRDDKQSTTTEN